jgi:hypothetical protein
MMRTVGVWILLVVVLADGLSVNCRRIGWELNERSVKRFLSGIG